MSFSCKSVLCSGVLPSVESVHNWSNCPACFEGIWCAESEAAIMAARTAVRPLASPTPRLHDSATCRACYEGTWCADLEAAVVAARQHVQRVEAPSSRLHDWTTCCACYEGVWCAELEAAILGAREVCTLHGRVSRVNAGGKYVASALSPKKKRERKKNASSLQRELASDFVGLQSCFAPLNEEQDVNTKKSAMIEKFVSIGRCIRPCNACDEGMWCSVAESAFVKRPISKSTASTADNLPSVGPSEGSDSDEAGSDDADSYIRVLETS